MLLLDISDLYIERIWEITCSLSIKMPWCPVFTRVVLSVDVILSKEVDDNTVF